MIRPLLDRLLNTHEEHKRLRPFRSVDCRELDFLSVDLELNSLNPSEGDILSIGYVPIVGGKIVAGQGGHILVDDHSGVGDSAVIHGIRDCDADDGEHLKDALAQLNKARQGRILLFHHAGLDLSFLAKHEETYRGIPAIDTLLIEHKRRQRQNLPLENALRLNQCRERYNLPVYNAHNALTDALATAELFLAQLAYLGGSAGISLKEALFQSR